ncbi:sigma-70 family RNA polymerase sigma factor [Asticcacaulis sp. ZE23SCel15]|uniref:RNA polymerase sigma factor n=1 Tax=Asticcacaulis sp. ZE23SCel15 TaxID=3059027 RepID=UPI0026605448|nr:sigma-70 family RNA polymerase sigma factor [Asticcacaulis sp. ZE23SCel15]WKL57614.1 sigma-70 family RNA polymerase sigma factor [Asticcacaulis sp. ZE23SCel15]
MADTCAMTMAYRGGSFDALSRRLRTPLMQFFMRRTGSQADAEELVQELFLRLLRRKDLFSLQNLDGYVFETASNLIRDKVRRDTARSKDRHDDVSDLDIATDAPSAEQSLEARQRLNRMLAALDTLPARAQTIVILRRFEDMSYAQIAKRLGISISAVEKHMVRAMDALKQID